MAEQGLNVKLIIVGLAFFALFSFNLAAQTADLSKLVFDQIIRPSNLQIRSAFRVADPNLKCSVRYMAVKFVVDSKTLACDTVIFSKSIEKFKLDPNAFKNFEINWRAIIDTSQGGQVKKFEIIQPISFFMGECFDQYPKLKDDQIWDLFTDLIMMDKQGRATVIMLQPSYFTADK